jgi:RHS repeat-associated protein
VTTAGNGTPGNTDNFLYFYHPDHLGSTGFVTDVNGKLYEHIEYFPFGETWVAEHSNTQRTPYLFTGKELDEETGLYYFGARYYDPRTSVWQSADPILGKYLPTGDGEKDKNLPGMGGVFNSSNLGLYVYVQLNPLKYVDPDGEELVRIINIPEFHGGQSYPLWDSTIAQSVANVVNSARAAKIPLQITEGFRTPKFDT